MKLPARPPTIAEIWARISKDKTLDLEIFRLAKDSNREEKYLHWDQLRHLDPPAGFSHEEWWFATKLGRGERETVPLHDSSGKPFGYSIADPLPKSLHEIDLSAGGGVQLPEAVTNSETKESYIVRSLIEESITSSQLEGAATTREVAREMIREGRRPRDRSEQMIYNNYQTMQWITSLRGRPLSRELVLEIHRKVTSDTLDDPSAAGRFRRLDENIVIATPEAEVLHVPPPADQLDDRMQAMCAFANGAPANQFVHPAIRAMILHFWLAYDHPFVDGNGRTARALFYWSMLQGPYWLFEYISISQIILRAPVRYGRAFLYTETDDNDLTYFLLYHCEVIRKAIGALYEHVEQRSRDMRTLETKLRGIVDLNSRQRDLISHALRHPGQRYTIESHRASHNVVYQTARADLLDLVRRGLLIRRRKGQTLQFIPALDLEQKLARPG